DFAVRRVAAVEIVAVPRCQTDRAVMWIDLGDIDASADDVGLADSIDAAAFRDRLTSVDDARARRYAVSRVDTANPAGAAGERERGCRKRCELNSAHSADAPR